jgi:hypothetical protein
MLVNIPPEHQQEIFLYYREMNTLIDTVNAVHPASFLMASLAWLVYIIPGLAVALLWCLALWIDDKAGDKFKLLGFVSVFLAFLVTVSSSIALIPITLGALGYVGLGNMGITPLLVIASYVTNFAVGYSLTLAFTAKFVPAARELL